MRSLTHSGDISNIAYYREGGTRRAGDIWCEVQRSDFYYTGTGRNLVKHVRTTPRFRITICRRERQGTVAAAEYRPRKLVAPGPLPADVVTRLVRKALKGREDAPPRS